jgi:hypothetical protein
VSTKERPRATRTQALQSPFVDEEVLTWGPAQAWEPRTSALVTHSAFVHPRAQPDTTHPALEADTRLIATEANGAPGASSNRRGSTGWRGSLRWTTLAS